MRIGIRQVLILFVLFFIGQWLISFIELEPGILKSALDSTLIAVILILGKKEFGF